MKTEQPQFWEQLRYCCWPQVWESFTGGAETIRKKTFKQ